LYESEWTELVLNGSLTHFLVAFSRDQKHKVYVQNKMKECGTILWDVINRQQGIFYISGSAGKMPQAVRGALKEIIETEGRMDTEAAEKYLKTMELKRRFFTETWY